MLASRAIPYRANPIHLFVSTAQLKTKKYFTLDQLNRRKDNGIQYFGDHKDVGSAWYQQGEGQLKFEGKRAAPEVVWCWESSRLSERGESALIEAVMCLPGGEDVVYDGTYFRGMMHGHGKVRGRLLTHTGPTHQARGVV